MVYFICINIRACVCVSNVGIERSRECGGGGVAGTAEHQHQGHVNVPARNGSGAGYMVTWTCPRESNNYCAHIQC